MAVAPRDVAYITGVAFAPRDVAYITGAGSGIGQASAYALARQGVRCFTLIHDRNPILANDESNPLLGETIDQLQKDYPDVHILCIEVDLKNQKAVNRSVSITVQHYGRIDYAVNNAGISGGINTRHYTDAEDLVDVVAKHNQAVGNCLRAQIQHMLVQEYRSHSHRSFRGSIVNLFPWAIGSSANFPITAFARSKQDFLERARAEARAMAPHGIKISSICPEYVNLTRQRTLLERFGIANGEPSEPLERFGDVEELADCIAFLHSEASSYMMGASMVGDGGFIDPDRVDPDRIDTDGWDTDGIDTDGTDTDGWDTDRTDYDGWDTD